MIEFWKEIEGYEGLYWVSNKGRVKNKENRLLNGTLNSHGYLVVGLSKNGESKKASIHRLVAMMFIPNRNKSVNSDVHHIDGNPLNNNINNLMWCTRKYNNSEPVRIDRATKNVVDVIKEIKAINPKVTYIGGYKNVTTKCSWFCNVCRNKWLITPNNLKSGYGCPQCANKKKLKSVTQYKRWYVN